MAEQEIVKAQVVRKGVFDLGDLYYTVYSFVTDTLGYSFSEDDYSQWSKDYGTDIEFHWTFNRAQESYVHYRIWLECKVRGANKVKTKIGDKVATLDKAEIEFNIKAVLITDPGGEWANHPLLKHLKRFYEEYIYRSQIEEYIDRLAEHLYNLEGEIKAFFNLPSFT